MKLRLWLAIAVLTGAATGCGQPLIGDAGYSVTTKNGTEVPLVVYVDDVGAGPGTAMAQGVRLAPGADDVDNWIVPNGPRDSRRAKVRAMTLSNDLYYCHQFGFEDLRRVQFHVLIGPGVNDCK
jgi:hypothetical protein